MTATAAVDGWAARLDRVDRALADVRSGATGLTRQQTSVRLAALLSERANLSGSDADAHDAEDVATAALAAGCRHADLILTLAQLYADGHDLVRAATMLDRLWGGESAGQGAIRAGILRQRGQLVAAAVEYARLIRIAPSWQHLAGLAGVYADLADVNTADALFARAADDIDALQMGAFAWVEVQRAQLWLVGAARARGPAYHPCRDRLRWLARVRAAGAVAGQVGFCGEAVRCLPAPRRDDRTPRPQARTRGRPDPGGSAGGGRRAP